MLGLFYVYERRDKDMGQENILNEFMNLPPEAQRQVVDFIFFTDTLQAKSVKKIRTSSDLG